MSTEKSRNLMLKGSTVTASSSQNHQSNVPLNVLRGASIITSLEQQKYPTTFVPCTSDFDNLILPVAPQIPQLAARPDPAAESASDNAPSSSSD